jgi:hypothetical protein
MPQEIMNAYKFSAILFLNLHTTPFATFYWPNLGTRSTHIQEERKNVLSLHGKSYKIISQEYKY